MRRSIRKLMIIVLCWTAFTSGLAASELKKSPWKSNSYSLEYLFKCCELLSTAGLSWPDGRQAIVLHFLGILSLPTTTSEIRGQSFYQCIEYFDASMTSIGYKCVSMGPFRL